MITGFIVGALTASVLTTKPQIPQIPSNQFPFSRALTQEVFDAHTVHAGEYMTEIALKYFGSEDYWTTIWNDNPWIKDPGALEENWVLKIRKVKPDQPEILTSDLENRLADVNIVSTSYAYSVSADGTGYVQAQTATMAIQSAAPIVNTSVPHVLTEEQLNYLGSCEAGMNPAKNTGNGFYGAFQFSYGTWKSMGTGYERADLAPIEVQKQAVQQLAKRSSIFTQFPACSQRMRSNGLI